MLVFWVCIEDPIGGKQLLLVKLESLQISLHVEASS